MRAWVALPAIVLLATVGHAAGAPPLYTAIVGTESEYPVAPGDSLWSITGRFTMSRGLFDALNALPDPDHLHPGMRLRISDRHIVPARRPDGIVIDVTSRTLYWFAGARLKARFPVGIGRSDWATPAGRYRIVGRREDPIWRVPASIQEEMRLRGTPVAAVVTPGPDNPLGKYWIQLSKPGLGLHGTNAPASIGKYATHGCLRLLPDHVERLYREAPDGTAVDVISEPVKMARDAGGRVWLEVHRDVYGRRPADIALAAVRARVDAHRLENAVDPIRIMEVVERAWGTPEDVTAEATPLAALSPEPSRPRPE
jgi:L,D-transpeptidase ErfK/SrfK